MTFRFFTKTNKNRALVLVLLPYSFDHLPSYQTPIMKLMQVIDCK